MLPEAVVLSISRVVVSNDAVVEDVAEVVSSSVVFPSTFVLLQLVNSQNSTINYKYQSYIIFIFYLL